MICASASTKQEAIAYITASILAHTVSATMPPQRTKCLTHVDVVKIVDTGEGRWWRDDSLVCFPNVPPRIGYAGVIIICKSQNAVHVRTARGLVGEGLCSDDDDIPERWCFCRQR